VKALAYTLEGISVGTDQETKETIVAPRVAWGLEHVDVTADQALAAAAGGKDEPTAKEANVEFLNTVLDDGPVKVEEIAADARAAGLLNAGQPINKDKPFREAKKALGIKSYQPKGEKGAGWYWALPKHQAPLTPSGALLNNRAPDGVRAPAILRGRGSSSGNVLI